MIEALAAILAGLGAGILSGLFGLGGAIITTPVVRLVFERPELIAVGTPLVVIVPSTLTGAWAYVRRGSADVRAGLVVGAAGVPTALMGAWTADLVGGGPVLVVTAVLLGYLAIRMVGTVKGPVSRRRDMDSRTVSPIRLVGLGVAAGFVSGFMGLGGGFLIVPALVMWFGHPMRRAVGTSLIAITVFAVPGALAHWMLGHVDVRLAAFLAIGAVPGAFLGARLTVVARERTVRIAFGAVLAITGIILGVQEGAVLLGG